MRTKFKELFIIEYAGIDLVVVRGKGAGNVSFSEKSLKLVLDRLEKTRGWEKAFIFKNVDSQTKLFDLLSKLENVDIVITNGGDLDLWPGGGHCAIEISKQDSGC